jgi:hypothetical protein
MKYHHVPKAKLAFKLLEDVLSNDLDEDLENFIGEVQALLNKALEVKTISTEISSGFYKT